MTVHRHDSHLCGVTGSLDTGYIAIGIKGHTDFARLMRLDIIAHDLHLRIHLSWNRILVGIVARILGILAALGCQTLEELHRILLHRTFIIANPHNLSGVCREHHRRIGRKLLLIHPIGNTVDDGIALTILGHLTLCIVIEQFHQIDIILTHKGYLIAVWREHWCLLGASIAERSQLVIANIENVIDCRKGVAINRFRLCLNQHPPSVRT